MMQRNYIGMPAQLTFTMDFHELLTGDLRPGRELRLSYDPLRIAPADEPVVHGDPAWPITAHARFHRDGPVTSVALASTGRVATPVADPTGQRGLMVWGNLVVPDDAAVVSLWFTYVTPRGEERRDDDSGKTYCFRFPSQDIVLLAATVTPEPQATSAQFAVQLAAIPEVETVAVRYHIVNDPSMAEGEVELARSNDHDEQGRIIWSRAGVSVPIGSLIKYKVYYWIGGFRYKEDNSSSYFLAPQQPAEEVPPPPQDLVEATMNWHG